MTYIKSHDGALINVENADILGMAEGKVTGPLGETTKNIVFAALTRGQIQIGVFDATPEGANEARALLEELGGVVGAYDPVSKKLMSYPEVTK